LNKTNDFTVSINGNIRRARGITSAKNEAST